MIVNKKQVMSKKYIMIVVVCIVTGFIIGYSYNLSKDRRESGTVTSAEYQKENVYRQQLIDQQERNKQLVDELSLLEGKLRQFEREVASEEQQYNDMLSEVNELRFLLGYLPAKGEGVRIQLEDGDYDPMSTNPNDYIIHESHLFKLINELKIAGAEGISINGKRLHANSYIICNGPVITIDGEQFPAPFVVEAIGNKDTLVQAIEITGGVVDQLLNDKINLTIEKRDQIALKSINGDA